MSERRAATGGDATAGSAALVHDPAAFRAGFLEAMSQLAVTVLMVTTRIDDRAWGLTISAYCSVSADPPTLLVSLGRHTASASSIRRSGRFGVNVLSKGQQATARVGSAAGRPKFVDELCAAEDLLPGAPVVAGCLAHMACATERVVEVADHVLFVGTVTNLLLGSGSIPLVYYGRDYAELDEGDPWYS